MVYSHCTSIVINRYLILGGDRHKHPKDLPVHSRLFVVHGKDTNESDLREAFNDHGEVSFNEYGEGEIMLKKGCPDTGFISLSFSPTFKVEDVNMLKKKCPDTRELICTGVSFVKFKKASQAAKAIEELHGKVGQWGDPLFSLFFPSSFFPLPPPLSPPVPPSVPLLSLLHTPPIPPPLPLLHQASSFYPCSRSSTTTPLPGWQKNL